MRIRNTALVQKTGEDLDKATLHILLFSATNHLYIVVWGGGVGWVVLELRNMVCCSMNLLLIPNLTLPVKNMHREQLVFGKMIEGRRGTVQCTNKGRCYVCTVIFSTLFIRFCTAIASLGLCRR